jgi:putative transcriptional regulator
VKKHLLILIVLITTLSTAFARQVSVELAPRAGMLLVAAESINDPRFQQSVILITQHNQAGTSGLILNRALGELPEELKSTLSLLPEGLYWGGPVSPLQVTGLLLDAPGSYKQGQPIGDGLKILAGEQLEEALHNHPLDRGEMRVYFGYAGWAPAQLAAEIARGDWHVRTPDVSSLRKLPPEQLWSELAPSTPSEWI